MAPVKYAWISGQKQHLFYSIIEISTKGGEMNATIRADCICNGHVNDNYDYKLNETLGTEFHLNEIHNLSFRFS